MDFEKYQHIERLGSSEVRDVLFGKCYVFYKIDGTNASVWLGIDGLVKSGSRNRELTIESDNAGFCAWATQCENLYAFLKKYPTARLFGEWLVPHSLKTYNQNAWRKFYVFDVMVDGFYLNYDEYSLILESFGIDYIPPIAICTNPSVETIYKLLEKTGQFLIDDGKGNGEGLVIKNYDFTNKHGRKIWAKVITSEFKERHTKTMGAPIIESKELVEIKIVEQYCTRHFIEKEFLKLCDDDGSFDLKKIPMMLNVIYDELIKEESYNFVKKFKNPIINYKTLYGFTVRKIKQVMKDLF